MNIAQRVLNAANEDAETPLHEVAESGTLPRVNMLLGGDDLEHGMHDAAEFGSLKLLNKLLKNVQSQEIKDSDGLVLLPPFCHLLRARQALIQSGIDDEENLVLKFLAKETDALMRILKKVAVAKPEQFNQAGASLASWGARALTGYCRHHTFVNRHEGTGQFLLEASPPVLALSSFKVVE